MSARILLLLTSFSALYLLRALATATQTEIREVTDTSEDPKCAKGFYPGFQFNSFQLAVSSAAFINKTGSFLHGEWYSGPLSWSKGEDNTVGTVRAELFETSLLIESLVGHYRSPTQSVIRFKLDNGPVTLKEFVIDSYTEEHRAMSICGGKAILFTMAVVYCVDNEPASYDLFDRYRIDAVQKVADELKALNFGGTCPH
ncbi:hypothetical protein H0H93_004266 [Arthromyces matolae]|nr:hypothetical protein H0H93_004266 [Arthromyces matolae]